MCKGSYLCGSRECPETQRRSIAFYPDIDKYWIYELNQDVDILKVARMSNKERWFRCKQCLHQYFSTPNNFCSKKGCAYCGSKSLCTDSDCQQCYQNSLASFPNIDKYWSSRNVEITPRQIFKNSNKEYFFHCKKCGHLYPCVVSKFISRDGCRYCPLAGNRLCEDLSCGECHQLSFASDPMSQYMVKKNIARTLRRFSDDKYDFNCPHCNNVYTATINSVSQGKWCPCKKRKTEAKFLSWIRSRYPQYDIKVQYKLPGMGRHGFDVSIIDLNVHIEIDGPQHFGQVMNWQDASTTRIKDTFKAFIAMQMKHSVIRILQEDIWDDRIDWQTKMGDAITNIKQRDYIFISSDMSLYDTHNKMIKRAYDIDNIHKGITSILAKIVKALRIGDGCIVNDSPQTISSLRKIATLFDIKIDDEFDALLYFFRQELYIPTKISYGDKLIEYKFDIERSLYHLIGQL